MNPLAVDIWIYIACGYVLVSLTFWIVARFSPLEWVPLQQQRNPTLITSLIETNVKLSHPKCDTDHESIELMHKQHLVNKYIDGSNKLNDEVDVESQINNCKKHFAKTKSEDLWWPDNRLHLPTSFLNMEDCNISDAGRCTELLTIKNNFTLRNCFWFAISALMQQSSDLYPRVIFSLL